MLYAHIKEGDPLGEKILDTLKDISAAHQQLASEDEESFLRENEHTIKGELAIFRYLSAYGKTLEAQREISADACYINPETGGVC